VSNTISLLRRNKKRITGRSNALKTVLLSCEKLESRLCMAASVFDNDGTDARILRDNVSPGPRVIYYDYVENGVLSGGRIDQDLYEPWCTALPTNSAPSIQAHNVSTLINNGPSSNRIDISIVGDGYTNAELANYATHVNNFLPTFFAESPFDKYASFFNVHRVDVVSNQSGVDNDPTQGVMKNTALDMAYWGFGIERLLVIDTAKAATAAASAPDVDQVLALANSTKYGGAGYAANNLGTFAGNNSSAIDVALHEFGHSFADLADEYDYADGATYTGPEFTEPNVSIKTAAQIQSTQTKWHRWLPEANVDSFEGAAYKQFGVYRPTSNSMMRSLGQPFEQVNTEQIIVSAYKTVQPIDSATAAGTYSAAKILVVDPVDPIGHQLSIQWILNGNPIAGATGKTLDVSLLNLPAGAHTISVKVVDNTPLVRDPVLRNTWMTETRSWTINAIANAKPVIANFGANRNYTENALPTMISSAATVSDPDSANFSGGRIYVTLASGGQSTDKLSIHPNAIVTLNTNQILVSGVVVGTFSGGAGTTPLVISFNSAATVSRAQSVLRAVAFSNTSEAPPTTVRNVRVQITDGDGAASLVSAKNITVTPVNDRPVIGGITGTLAYTQNTASIRIAPAATVTDPDSNNLDTGVLTVAITAGADVSNRILIAGGLFTVDAGNNVFRNGVLIGTRNVNGGTGTTNLVVTFNSNATKTTAQELLRALYFRTLNGSNTTQRNIRFTLSDGDGGTSLHVNRQINVT
jgi:IgA Peptidase M64